MRNDPDKYIEVERLTLKVGDIIPWAWILDRHLSACFLTEDTVTNCLRLWMLWHSAKEECHLELGAETSPFFLKWLLSGCFMRVSRKIININIKIINMPEGGRGE